MVVFKFYAKFYYTVFTVVDGSLRRGALRSRAMNISPSLFTSMFYPMTTFSHPHPAATAIAKVKRMASMIDSDIGTNT